MIRLFNIFTDFISLIFESTVVYCVDMTEDDEQKYNECDDDWSVGSCFLISTLPKAVPRESSEEKDV